MKAEDQHWSLSLVCTCCFGWLSDFCDILRVDFAG